MSIDERAPDPSESRALLVERYESLGLADRARALLAAREAGRRSADTAASAEELEAPQAVLYHDRVVLPSPAASSAPAAVDAWKAACENGQALRDPRVQAFFFGWHERAVEVLAELGERGADAEPARARWFLESLKP